MRRAPWFALVLLAACGGSSPSTGGAADTTSAGPALSHADLEASLVQADVDFQKAVQEHRIGGWISAFSEDGMMVTATGTAIGEEGIRRVMMPLFQDSTYQLTWEPSFAKVSDSGTMGYTVGRAESRRVVNGREVVRRGSYLTVWRRQPDGKWRVEADIGTMEEAP